MKTPPKPTNERKVLALARKLMSEALAKQMSIRPMFAYRQYVSGKPIAEGWIDAAKQILEEEEAQKAKKKKRDGWRPS